MQLGKEFLRGLLHLLYPSVCHACGEALPADWSRFCPACRSALTTDPTPACPRCAANLGPYAFFEDGCSRCKNLSLHFSQAIRLGPYDSLLRDLILRMKHASGEGLAETLGMLWAEALGAQMVALGAEVVIPIPLHWRRRWWRGYNQSEVLAAALAAHLKLPFRPGWLRRVRHTPPQTEQTPGGRAINVRGAFRATPWARLAGKTVLIVDDVLTTGNTCSEAARALQISGAVRVVAAVLARSTH